MFGLLPSKAKKKRAHEDHPHLKRTKIDNNNVPSATKNSAQFETTLSPPIQAALCKFREASEQELTRLRKEGMDPSTAINKLVQKMRTIASDVQPRFTRQELELVMEIAGVNEEGATRALILRSELAKLRHDGFNHPEAINELSRRMKRLAGSKRRGSSSMEKSVEKHRRKEKDNNNTTHTNTNTDTTTTTTSTTSTPSRVSFPSFDPLEGLELVSLPPSSRFVPISTSSTLTPTQTSSLSSTPLSALAISRKRLQDALMLEGERYGLLKKRPKYDKDISDSDNEGENASDSEEGEHYGFIDEGEFSHDDERLDEEDEGSEGDLSLRTSAFTHNNYSSSDEDRGMDDDVEGEWQSHLLFNEIKEEESDTDEHAWRLAPPSITSPISPSHSHSPSTTTTATSSTSPYSTFYPSSTPSPPPSPPRIHTTKTSKRRDTTPSSSSSSSSFIPHRTTKS